MTIAGKQVGLKFDWTVSLGTLIHITVLLIVVTTAWVSMNVRIGATETRLAEHMELTKRIQAEIEVVGRNQAVVIQVLEDMGKHPKTENEISIRP